MKSSIYILFLISLCSQTLSAQFRFGAGMNLIDETGQELGLSVQGQFAITESIIPQASLTYFFVSEVRTLDVELRYRLSKARKSFSIDPIGGVSLITGRFNSSLGIAVGGYMTFTLHNCTNIYVHPKFALYDNSNAIFLSTGILF